MVKAALQGDFNQARYYNTPLLAMYKWIFIEGSPSGIKFVLNYMGLCSDELRIPLLSLSSSSRKAMMIDLEKAVAFESHMQ